MKYKVGSLFAGVGGVCLGFKQAEWKESGYELVWANEIDNNACKTYRRNFEHEMLEGDINKVLEPESSDSINYYEKLKSQITAERIDILTGGFPCQAFSIAGERKGFEDERGNLFLSIIKLINLLEEKTAKPRVLFLENVKNLKAHDGGRTYQVIKQKIQECGYMVNEFILNSMEYSNMPQNRERMYIICFKEKADQEKFEKLSAILNTKMSFNKELRLGQVGKLLDKEVIDKYYYTAKKYPRYFMNEIDEEKGVKINLTEQINEIGQFYQVRRGMYVRKNMSNVCPTLTANMGTGGHNVPLIYDGAGVRKLTPKETFKLQGFPIGDGYELPSDVGDAQLYKQAGNAVTVPVVKKLAEIILQVLER